MPFTSQAQRGLFYAAKADPAVRERTGISKSVATKMTGEDPGGKLPQHVPKHMAQGGRIEAGTREQLDPGVARRAPDVDPGLAHVVSPYLQERGWLDDRGGAAGWGGLLPGAGFAPRAPVRGFARGGHPHVGEPVIVGEQGPEIFMADRPG